MTIQIRNKFGTSEPLHIPVVTMLEPIKQLAETKVKNEEDKNEILAMILGGLVTTILLVIVILLVSFSYRRRLLEHSAATLSSTSARLLETHPEQKPSDMAQFSSYTINSKQSTTTFNSNLFVPSISNDIYGQVNILRQKLVSNIDVAFIVRLMINPTKLLSTLCEEQNHIM